MKIISTSRTAYTLEYENGHKAGSLIYKDDTLNEAQLTCDKEYHINQQTFGSWVTKETSSKMLQAVCQVKVGGTIILNINDKQYTFKKPLSWKLRFTLLTIDKEEILALLPSANWKIQSYNFILQLNDELIKESDSFLILQALHCAVCCMAMMNGIISTSIFC